MCYAAGVRDGRAVRRAHRHALLLLSILGAWSGNSGANAAPPAGYEPAPERARGARWHEGAWIVEGPALRARVRALDPAERQRYLSSRTGLRADPFSESTAADSFFTFLLDIENPAAGPLVFQSQACRLVTPRKEFLHPLDLPAIASAYGLLDRPLPAAFETIRRALFDGETILPAGGGASGLLVFPRPHPRTRWFTVEIAWMGPQGEHGTFAIAYERSKPRAR